jgi:hypothetical protein
MLEAMKLSLQLFSERFSPFQFKQARILEFPAYANFAQSFANTIPYSEAIGFIAHPSDPSKIDMVTYVTAHEIGHQWWGHQLVPSDQQGATMLIETFAQYSALLVMEKMYGRDQIRRFLKYELDRYLRARGGEVVEELPLARVEDQPYIHYQKGSLAMYWLKEVVGEAVVDRALAKFLQQYAFKVPPYPNTKDFLAILRAEAGPQHDALITDLFERITLLDMKTTAATTRKLPDGRHELTLQIEAHKRYADGKGQETEAPLDEEIDIGAFTVEPGKTGFEAGSVLALSRHRIVSGLQTGHADARQATGLGGRRPVQQAHRPQLRRQPESGERGPVTQPLCSRAARARRRGRRARLACSLGVLAGPARRVRGAACSPGRRLCAARRRAAPRRGRADRARAGPLLRAVAVGVGAHRMRQLPRPGARLRARPTRCRCSRPGATARRRGCARRRRCAT